MTIPRATNTHATNTHATSTQRVLPFWWWIALAVLVVVLDQSAKSFISSTLMPGEQVEAFALLSWVHVHNPGAAFSFLNDAGGWQRWALSALAIVFSVFIIFELRNVARHSLTLSLAFALILGGAVGNLTDRLLHGYVVDFILVHWQSHVFPIFNLADSAISLGATLWVAHLLFDRSASRVSA